MDRREIYAVAKAAGLPTVYRGWKAGGEEPMPYVVYRFSYSNDLMADNMNYLTRETWQIELYAESKDDAHEMSIQQALKEAGLKYEKREYTFDTPKSFIQTIFIVKTIG